MDLPTLETGRLLLRPLGLSDVPDVTRLAGAREVAATTLRIPHPYTVEDAQQFIAASRTHAEKGVAAVFAIVLRNPAQLCGAIGLEIEPAHRRAELGYWIGVPHWSRGYATEAACAALHYGFETLQLERIFASHFRHNPASGRVLKKLGMRHEGCLRAHILKWGEFVDLEAYGLLRSEFIP